jgi:hypothetical protein
MFHDYQKFFIKRHIPLFLAFCVYVLSICIGCNLSVSKEQGPIVFDSNRKDFGLIKAKSDLHRKFTFTNKGSFPAKITTVRSGCACNSFDTGFYARIELNPDNDKWRLVCTWKKEEAPIPEPFNILISTSETKQSKVQIPVRCVAL